jgi:hypothetical protein
VNIVSPYVPVQLPGTQYKVTTVHTAHEKETDRSSGDGAMKNEKTHLATFEAVSEIGRCSMAHGM